MRRFVLPAVLPAAFAALPAIARETGVAATTVTWALTAFMLLPRWRTRSPDGSATCSVTGACCWPVSGVRRGHRPVRGEPVVPAAARRAGGVRRGVPGGVRAGPADRRGATAAGVVVAGPVRDAWGTAWLFWPLLGLVLVALVLGALVLGALVPQDAAAGGGRPWSFCWRPGRWCCSPCSAMFGVVTMLPRLTQDPAGFGVGDRGGPGPGADGRGDARRDSARAEAGRAVAPRYSADR